MEINETTLLALKAKIDKGKTRLAELKGEKNTLLATLKKEYKCETVAEAEALIKKLNNDISRTEKEIREQLLKLEEDFPDLFTNSKT